MRGNVKTAERLAQIDGPEMWHHIIDGYFGLDPVNPSPKALRNVYLHSGFSFAGLLKLESHRPKSTETPRKRLEELGITKDGIIFHQLVRTKAGEAKRTWPITVPWERFKKMTFVRSNPKWEPISVVKYQHQLQGTHPERYEKRRERRRTRPARKRR